ncbi:MAG TPA: hypothetical protein DDZ88_29875 [Verrucomicrobiales bacterium]|nr:hypothetical protein [Verrucomicrobiales bacterium]
MQKNIQRTAAGIFHVYFLVFILIATPYFNYRYAKEHSYGAWLAFGAVAATAKAAIWPYYFVTDFTSRGSSQYPSIYSGIIASLPASDRASVRICPATSPLPDWASSIGQHFELGALPSHSFIIAIPNRHIPRLTADVRDALFANVPFERRPETIQYVLDHPDYDWVLLARSKWILVPK